MYDVVNLTAQKFKLVFDEIDGESIWYDFQNILSNACVDEGFIPHKLLKAKKDTDLKPGIYWYEFIDGSTFALNVSIGISAEVEDWNKYV